MRLTRPLLRAFLVAPLPLLFSPSTFGGIQLGTLKLAEEFSLAAPQPLKLGAEIYCTADDFFCSERLRYYMNVGYIQYPFSSSSTSFSIFSVEAGTRYFPWQSVFYVGLGLGYRQMGVSANISAFQVEGETVATSANMNLSTPYLSPTLGVNISVGKSIFLGFDLGVQVPIFAAGSLKMIDSTTGTTSDTSAVLKVTSDRAMGRIAGLIIPTVTLIRFSYYMN